MSALQVTYSAGDGLLVQGTARGDGSAEVLRAKGMRWSASCPGRGEPGFWYLPRSRDHQLGARAHAMGATNSGQLAEDVASALRAAGHEVTIDVDETRRSTAEVEADRAAALSGRANRLEARAGRLDASAVAMSGRAREMADAIPFGQPMMPDHHSYGQDRRYRERMGRTMDEAVATGREAEDAARRAASSRAAQEHRLAAPATIRRIAKLEADRRGFERRLETRPAIVNREELGVCIAQIDGELDHWRAHLAALAAEGVKLWGPTDFRPGDRVNESSTVVRVNRKTLTVRHDAFAHAGFTNPLPYDKVRTMSRPGEDQP